MAQGQPHTPDCPKQEHSKVVAEQENLKLEDERQWREIRSTADKVNNMNTKMEVMRTKMDTHEGALRGIETTQHDMGQKVDKLGWEAGRAAGRAAFWGSIGGAVLAGVAVALLIHYMHLGS